MTEIDRKLGLGGTDVAAIMKLYFKGADYDTFATPLTVWQDKLGISKPREETERMHMGKVLEEVVAQEYSDRTGNRLVSANTRLIHKKYDYMRATIDRWAIDQKRIKFILECKSASLRISWKWGEEGTDDIPEVYLMQAAHYRKIGDVPFVSIALLIDNCLKIYRYEENKDLEEKIEHACVHFWTDYVLPKKQPPAITESDIKRMNLRDNKDAIIATSEIEVTSLRSLRLKKQITELKKSKEELDIKIKNFMGNNSTLTTQSGAKLASWAESKSRIKIDEKKLKEEQPAIYDRYITTCKPSRPFLIK